MNVGYYIINGVKVAKDAVKFIKKNGRTIPIIKKARIAIQKRTPRKTFYLGENNISKVTMRTKDGKAVTRRALKAAQKAHPTKSKLRVAVGGMRELRGQINASQAGQRFGAAGKAVSHSMSEGAGRAVFPRHIFSRKQVPNYRYYDPYHRYRRRSTMAHEAFHARTPIIGKSEVFASMYGGWKGSKRGTPIVERIRRGVENVRGYQKARPDIINPELNRIKGAAQLAGAGGLLTAVAIADKKKRKKRKVYVRKKK